VVSPPHLHQRTASFAQARAASAAPAAARERQFPAVVYRVAAPSRARRAASAVPQRHSAGLSMRIALSAPPPPGARPSNSRAPRLLEGRGL